MKLLKLITFVFFIYFIRRFIQLFRAMKKIQEEQARGQTFHKYPPKGQSGPNIINADFKVVD